MKYFTFIIILVLFTAGCRTPRMDNILDTKSEGSEYFYFKDDIDDDNGTGEYIYPTFSENRDEYDLKSVRIYEAGDFINFRVDFVGQVNRDTLADFWSVHLVDIYIDTDRLNTGHHETLPGRNLQFPPDRGWEKMVTIAPFHKADYKYLLENKTSILQIREMTRKKEIVVPESYLVGNYSIIARVLKKDIGIPNSAWGYQVVVMGFDSTATGPDELYAMKVRFLEGESNIGGGTNFDGCPAAMDIITPDGFSQKEILSNYHADSNPENRRLAVIPFVYSDNSAPARFETVAKKPAWTVQSETPAVKPVTKKEEKPLISKENIDPENQNEEECHHNMRMILQAAVNYHADNSEDTNITLFDLVEKGYLPRTLRCPSGGRYVISGEESDNIKVKCLNISGVSHGIFKEKGE